jgi:hypothetical protein
MLGRLSADEQALVLAATRDAHALSRCKAVNRGLRPIATRALQALLELDNSEMALLLEVLAGHTAASAALTREPSAKMRLAVLALMPCRHPGRYQKREGDACVLQYIKLENIMNHELAEMELHPSVTTLHGEGGTGKTALNLAISHALGAVSRPPRFLLRHGAQSGRILLWFSVPVPFGRPATLLLETTLERNEHEHWNEHGEAVVSQSMVNGCAGGLRLLRDAIVGDAGVSGLRDELVGFHADLDWGKRLVYLLLRRDTSVPQADGAMTHTVSIAAGGPGPSDPWSRLVKLGRLDAVSAAARAARCAHIESELRRLLEVAGMSVTQQGEAVAISFGEGVSQLSMVLGSPPGMGFTSNPVRQRTQRNRTS